MKKSISLMITCLILFTAIFMGCDKATHGGKEVNSEKPDKSSSPTTSSLYDYGNGVYYISATGAKFGEELSKFIANYPNLEVVALSSNGTGVYGQDQGVWVICKNKNLIEKEKK